MRVEEISLKAIKQMTIEELCALYRFLEDSTEENWNRFTLARLKVEREKLITKEVPESQWPKQLQGEDWGDRIKKKFGLKLKEEVKEKMG